MMTKEFTIQINDSKSKGGFGPMVIEIFSQKEKIGEYQRDYGSLFNTHQFVNLNDKDYAIYSPHYQETAIMSLPDCKKIASYNKGFCPTDFWIPQYMEYEYSRNEVLAGNIYRIYEPDIDGLLESDSEIEVVTQKRYAAWGFVSGCVWGDDSSDKIQYLDLSKLESGEIIQSNKFGYLELPGNGNLRNSIKLGTEYADWIQFEINTKVDFRQIKDGSFGMFSHFHGASGYVDPITGESINDTPETRKGGQE